MKKYNPVVEDEKQLLELQTKFDQAELTINKRIYNSQTDEKNRIIRLKATKVFKATLNKISDIIKQQVLYDMHPSLELENVKVGTFFLSSNQTNKLPVKIVELNDELISILWFGAEGTKFQKTLMINQAGKNHVKVTYFDYLKGFKTIFGINESHFKNLYLSRQNLAFQIQMNKVLIQLSDDQKIKEKLILKNQRYQEKLVNKY